MASCSTDLLFDALQVAWGLSAGRHVRRGQSLAGKRMTVTGTGDRSTPATLKHCSTTRSADGVPRVEPSGALGAIFGFSPCGWES
jgi:hypothetical protein